MKKIFMLFLIAFTASYAALGQAGRSIATDCEVKSFSLDNFKVVMLDKNAALLTYTGMQDGVCSGKRYRQPFVHQRFMSNAAENGSRRYIWNTDSSIKLSRIRTE